MQDCGSCDPGSIPGRGKVIYNKTMNKILREFVSYENREYPFRIGKTVASALTGFIMGAVATHIIWFTAAKHILWVFGF